MSFEDLDVWKRSTRLSAEIYRKLRHTNDFGSRDQITRSGLPVPSNIAEGLERDPPRDCARFLQIAKGSCGELRTQILIGREIGYIDPGLGKKWVAETVALSSMLGGLSRKIKEKI